VLLFQHNLTDWNLFLFADVASEAFLSAISVGNLQCLLFALPNLIPIQSSPRMQMILFLILRATGVRLSHQVPSSRHSIFLPRRLLIFHHSENWISYYKFDCVNSCQNLKQLVQLALYIVALFFLHTSYYSKQTLTLS